MAKGYVNDHWTLDINLLGYEPLCKTLKAKIATCDPPYSFAVCGGWGSGKTSVLRYLMAISGGDYLRLDPEDELSDEVGELPEAVKKDWEGDKISKEAREAKKKYTCVWFNPWQHQFEQAPLVALLNEIRSQFSFWVKGKKTLQKNSKALLQSGLQCLDKIIPVAASSFGLPEGLGNAINNFRQNLRTQERDSCSFQLDSQRLPLQFEQAVSTLVHGSTENPDAKLIIFIDDMDRIQPEQAYQLLEAIKLLLHTPRCIFVFGIDYHRLVQRLAQLDVFEKSPTYAREYLEKMFQSLVPLPQPTDKKFEGFIKEQLKSTELDKLLAIKIPGLEAEKPLSLSKFLCELLEKNPRKAKNFINALKAQVEQISTNTSIDLQDGSSTKQCILVHFIRSIYPEAYVVLETHPETLVEFWHALKTENSPNNNYCRFFQTVVENQLVIALVAGGETDRVINQDKLTDRELQNMKDNTTAFHAKQRFSKHFTLSYPDLGGKKEEEKPSITDLSPFFHVNDEEKPETADTLNTEATAE